MTTFSPEFSAYWQSEPLPGPSRDNGDAPAKEALSTAQEIALEELAERVFAARSVI